MGINVGWILFELFQSTIADGCASCIGCIIAPMSLVGDNDRVFLALGVHVLLMSLPADAIDMISSRSHLRHIHSILVGSQEIVQVIVARSSGIVQTFKLSTRKRSDTKISVETTRNIQHLRKDGLSDRTSKAKQ